MVNLIFGDFVVGVVGVYGEEGYDMLFLYVIDGDEECVYIDFKCKGMVDGVIV